MRRLTRRSDRLCGKGNGGSCLQMSPTHVGAVVTWSLNRLMPLHTRTIPLRCSLPTPESGTTEPRELCFYETFELTGEDVHYLLLHEAHVKHGVLLNVPPQLAPNGTPPEVPEVIMPAAQLERMGGMKLAYEPTHLPPPLHTTGARQLVLDESFYTTPTKEKKATTTAVSHVSESTAASGGRGGASATAAGTALPPRLPPDPTMKFHCSACGKAFRLKFSADHHVKLNHGSDPKAAVVDGPGEGELLGGAVTITTAKVAKHSSSAASGTASRAGDSATLDVKQQPDPQKELSASGISAVKIPYSKAVLSLPDDELVDELLIDVWDAVAAQRDDVPKSNSANIFLPFASVVTGTADRRKEMEAVARPTARATPEGAAPGIKRPGAMAGGAVAVGKGRSGGQILPIRELIKKYPNPFGDSPNAAVQDLENEPLNPFLPEEELAAQLQVACEEDTVVTPSACTTDVSTGSVIGKKGSLEKLKEKLRGTRPSMAASAAKRRFTCPICVEKQQTLQQQQSENVGSGFCTDIPSFRLLDALLDHVESVHGEELTEDQLRELYAKQRQSTLYPQKSSTGDGAGSRETPDDSEKKEGSVGNTSMDELKSLPEEVRRVVPPAPVEQDALAVHIRAGSNALMIGRIADVQHGFLGTMTVTQYVLEVDGDERINSKGVTTPASACTPDPASTKAVEAKGEEGEVVEPEKEFIVIRCMGDNFPASLLKDQVKLGSRVLVQGTLRMNRHVDDVSKRLHAYPFIQVVPPLGYVKVVG
ncbi:RNA-editing complex protein MP81 [Trypanosoma brucei gambiense DAL972]|uniref:RNA-editing complex protein MP81 n=1 Tax=Trypanosoma brucei gambiense (strain MHOM/CI/86/DAL972) TaxID=679716 RepID=C9ZJ20_TRYB9|nr:RNA-editing complex protein MP81 [Trypanosoma brucei gambiense DAL972]CBH09378.1 RNA-editing complex protein MP81 [Trypanosoma brucei gambiense DAL972]|eukprot:XP_011771684.1 RNA-editing complex protein MP81 [Trypanosoma brucei gambiense DAL972]